MINFGNISIADLRLGATQVGTAYLGNKQIWSLGPVVPKYDILSIGRNTLQQGTSIEITEQAGETITLYIRTNATDLTDKQVCVAVYLNSTDVTPYASFAFSNASLVGRYIIGTTPDVSTWVPSGFPETYSTLYMKTWIQDTGYIDPADALGTVLDWTGIEHDPLTEPLCFTAISDYGYIQLNKAGSPDAISLEVSRDNITWNDYTVGTNIEINSSNNNKLYFRAKGQNSTISKDESNYYYFRVPGSGGYFRFEASGNIQTLLKADGSRMDAPAYCYCKLFDGFSYMTVAPALPATTLDDHCYDCMFNNCTSLTSAPALPATTLADWCYYLMFQGCRSLTSAPVISAMTLAEHCCLNMFSNCSSLTTALVLPATTLASSCYSGMFLNCTALTTAPMLPATTLANSCYSYMFSNCTSLTTAPSLPATTLAERCYWGMFLNCTALTTAPATLPATTLNLFCYLEMFSGCSSLTTAPSLSATALALGSCSLMFSNCTSLNSIEVAFTAWTPTGATANWLNNVAATGTFTCPAELPDTRGTGNIPDGWTKVDAA